MTEDEIKQQAFNNHQEYARRMYEEQLHQQRLQRQVHEAQQSAHERQLAIDSTPRRRYVMIAAVDLNQGIGKEGKLPWYYMEDLQWFKQHTTGHVCVMGKATYLDIVDRLGDKAVDKVLPNRDCFVVSTTLKQEDIKNATVITSIYDVEHHLSNDDHDKTIFFIGGERIFNDALSVVDTVLLTVINKEHGCDKFFPIDSLYKMFVVQKIQQASSTDQLRFVTYTRKPK